MPHIVIKAIEGATPEQQQECAKQISAVVNKTLGKADKYISVSYEGYSFPEWESVYNEFIKNKNNVILKPGYTDPKTFS